MSQLSAVDRESALRECLELALRPGIHKKWVSFVCCPFFELNWLEERLASEGFHAIDCELFRGRRRCATGEFLRLIDWDAHRRFALFVPRIVPATIARFLYWAVDKGIVNTEGDNLEANAAPKLSERSWILVMTPEDYSGASLETGWDRYRLTNALFNRCWLNA